MLGYHRIADAESALCVAPSAFRGQMESLLAWGLQPSRLEDLGPGRFSVTFDDGFLDGLTEAAPVLEGLDIPAYFYVCPRFVDGQAEGVIGRDYGAAADGAFLSWADLRRLEDSGHQIGSHSLSHRELPTLTDMELDAEVAGSKRAIETHLGHPVVEFCYPRGKHDERVRAAVDRAGYERAVVTPSSGRCSDSPFTIERIGIYRHDTPLRFRAKVTGMWGRIRPLVRR